MRVLVTGASGFVGHRLCAALARHGHEVIAASRDVAEARAKYPAFEWRSIDLDQPQTLGPAMEGCDAAYYLVHQMNDGGDFLHRELAAAQGFAVAADAANLKRIIYLGGVEPEGEPSKHLESRLQVGKTLRAGTVPCVELRASVIVGAGSQSWDILRDLAARLPVMVLPKWLNRRTQPVGIDDVEAALVAALDHGKAGIYSLPGPQVLTVREMLLEVSKLKGFKPKVIDVPLLTPKLSSLWIRLVTRANPNVSRALVEGMTSDLIARDEPFWAQMGDYRPLGFEQAATNALREEAAGLSVPSMAAEALIHRVAHD